MNNIEALRAKLLETANKGEKTTTSRNSGGDNASYPFWDIPVGGSATIRFLPDGDASNEYFWVKREVIKLPFSGVVGGDYPTQNDVTVTVPCIDMFGMKCPIVAATKHLWDKEETKDLARIYWKKKSWIFQGLVINSPIDEQNAPENPIRRFVINKSIYDKIYDALLDPELQDMPTDFDGGRDFTIKKVQKGQWANYDTSKFSMNPRSLTETERSVIDTNGLFNLKDALGAVPSSDAIEAMKAMLKDSIDGLPYDMDSYGQYFRPYGARDNSGSNGSTAAARNTTPAATEEVVETPVTNTKATDSARNVLEALRLRSQNNG